MDYTYEDVQAAIEKQIDYATLAEVLQTDLNVIADQVTIDDPSTEYISFKVFFDQGEFEIVSNDAAIGEGEGFIETPVLVKFVNGDYSTSRGPQFFSTVFSIEVFGFEKDRENLRKIFETYSYMNQGRIDSEEVGVYLVKTLEFPVFGESMLYKSHQRFQGFMRLFMSYMYDGQMSNEVIVTLNGESLKAQGLEITRTRTPKSDQVNEVMEVTNIYENQIITFSGGMIFDNSAAAILMLNGIKALNGGLNTQYALSITYPNISETPDTYTVYLDNGSISINEGGAISLKFVLTLAEV